MSTLQSNEAARLRAITAATPLDSILRAQQLDQLVRDALAATRAKPHCHGCGLRVHAQDAVATWTGGLAFHLRCAPPPPRVSIPPKPRTWPRLMVGVGPFRMELSDFVEVMVLRLFHRLGWVR